MSENTAFRRAADRMRQSAFVLPFFVVFFLLLVISLVIGVEDFATSYWGYEQLPTEKGFWWTAIAVALLPQVGQAASAYIAIALADNEEDRVWAILAAAIWAILLAVDVYTDSFYRADAGSGTVTNNLIITAVLQSLSIFTVGSELAFVVGFGMVDELLPDAIAETFSLVSRVKLSWHQRMSAANQRINNTSNRRSR